MEYFYGHHNRTTIRFLNHRKRNRTRIKLPLAGALRRQRPGVHSPRNPSSRRVVPTIEDKPLFRRLADISDRVIIDSALYNGPHGDVARMATVLHDTPRWTAISDLTWARHTVWRALLPGFYDIADSRPVLNK